MNKIKKKTFSSVVKCIVLLLFLSGWVGLGIALALKQADVNVGGTVTFVATGIYADIQGKIEGSITENKELSVEFNHKTPQEMSTEEWKNLILDFDDNNLITITLTITNKAENRDLYLAFIDSIPTDNLKITRKQGGVAIENNSFSNVKVAPKGVEVISIELSVINQNKAVKENFSFEMYLSSKEIKDSSSFTTLSFAENESKELSVSAKSSSLSGAVEIPSQVKYNNEICSITSIDSNAFSETSITSVSLPRTLKTINSSAFSDCTSLASVEFENGSQLTTIEENTFKNCSALTSITIPKSVNDIKKNAFLGCSSLSSVIFKNVNGWMSGTTNMDTTTPSTNASNLTGSYSGTDWHRSVLDTEYSNCKFTVLDSSSKTISFAGNDKSITSMIIPSEIKCTNSNWGGKAGETYTVTEIAKNAFLECRKLISVVIPDTVTTIGGSAFQSCNNLLAVTIPDSVTEISGAAFNGCTNLTKITLSKNVEKIGSWAFNAIYGLKELYLPASLAHIDGTSIVAPNLETLVVDSANTTFYSENNCLISYYQKTLYKMCSTSTIPSDVTRITLHACRNLTFSSIEIPESVTYIGEHAFYGCSKLTSVNIPKNVEIIGRYCFSTCTKLTTMTVDSQNTHLYDYANGIYADEYTINETTKNNVLVAGCNGTTEIKDTTTTIFEGVFNGCKSITSVTIPASVTSMGDNVFGSCTGIETLTVEDGNSTYYSSNNGIYTKANKVLIIGCKNTQIENDTTAIGEGAFSGYTNISAIEIPDSVTSIESEAFKNCSNITSITIPVNVTKIGSNAFSGCNKLTSVTFQTTTGWKAGTKTIDVTDAQTNAINLRTTVANEGYCDVDWTRS